MASWQEIFVPYVVSIYLPTGEHLGHILKEPNSVNFKDMSFIDSWCHISTTGDWPGVTNPPNESFTYGLHTLEELHFLHCCSKQVSRNEHRCSHDGLPLLLI